jgi:hypothetical protein
MALRWTVRVALVIPTLMSVAACMPQDGPPGSGNKTAMPPGSIAPGSSSVVEVTGPQPRTATYVCANGGTITVSNLGSAVRVVGSDGSSEDLQASPANQTSRYQQAHDAIVIDGREALVMKAGATPVSCRR